MVGQLCRLSRREAKRRVLSRRSITRIAREPEQLVDVTIQPIIFVLLFTYVFGSAIHLPAGGSYHQYLISGMFGMAMAGSAPGTAVGLTTDMSTGLMDRFRSLPIARSAVLAGRTLSDLSTQLLGIVVLACTGLAVGSPVIRACWRRHPTCARSGRSARRPGRRPR
jgi:ABC-2 type transport system permease protein